MNAGFQSFLGVISAILANYTLGNVAKVLGELYFLLEYAWGVGQVSEMSEVGIGGQPGLTIEGTASVEKAVALAWGAFEHAATLPSRVSPAAPVLFFGDLAAYQASRLRVLTVGLNPSLHEFPPDSPFRRFPLAEGVTPLGRDIYLRALSAYFSISPYRSWFRSFEPLLNGAESSYYSGATSTALHTDICSPVATNPTWTRLDKATQSALEADGGPLWHTLLAALQPHLVALSVAYRHLSRIKFAPLSEWEVVYTSTRTGRGSPRAQPYEACARWYDVGGEPSFFVFGRAAQTPFGLLNAEQKREAGVSAMEGWRRGR